MSRRPLRPASQAGQASLLLLAVLAALLAGVLVLFGFGQALGAKGKHQRAADLASISATQVMSRNYSRLFEPPFLEGGIPNPRHLSNAEYLALARAAARRGARRNGVPAANVAVAFPGLAFAATRVTVTAAGEASLRLAAGRRRDRVPVRARAAAELTPDLGFSLGMPTHGSGGGYDGPLAYRMGKPMRPDVAAAFDRMAAAARREARLVGDRTVGPPNRAPHQRAARGRVVRQIDGTLEVSVKTGTITLPGVSSWEWPSRWPISWITVAHSMSQSSDMLADVGQRQRARAITQFV